MAAYLAIDTASPEIGVALLHDEQVEVWTDRVGRGSESALGEAIATMIEKIDRVNGVVVSVGPGSFTALRVGVATALGIALASECKVLEICSLKARVLGHQGRTLAMLDGRKQRAYAALFEDGAQVGPRWTWIQVRSCPALERLHFKWSVKAHWFGNRKS